MAYVHVSCITTWQDYTNNAEFVRICSVCLHPYTGVPNMEEYIPDVEGTYTWALLSRFYLMWILCDYMYFLYNDIIPIQQTNTADGPRGRYDDYYNAAQNRNVYVYILTCATVAYALLYFKLVRAVQHKWTYISYWFHMRTYNGVWNPLMLLLTSIVSYSLMFSVKAPFNAIYFYTLPQYYTVHKAIIDHMNADIAAARILARAYRFEEELQAPIAAVPAAPAAPVAAVGVVVAVAVPRRRQQQQQHQQPIQPPYGVVLRPRPRPRPQPIPH